MSKLLVIALVAFCFVLLPDPVMAQAERAQSLAAALDKTKYKKKEKKNISVEVYAEVRNTPAVKASPAEYTGSYGSENDADRLDLRIAADGTAEGSGHDSLNGDNQTRAAFTLKNARITGAVLTATKAYTDGRSEPFEAVFVTRNTAHGKNPNEIAERKTAFGLGFVQTDKNWTNRVFLEPR